VKEKKVRKKEGRKQDEEDGEEEAGKIKVGKFQLENGKVPTKISLNKKQRGNKNSSFERHTQSEKPASKKPTFFFPVFLYVFLVALSCLQEQPQWEQTSQKRGTCMFFEL